MNVLTILLRFILLFNIIILVACDPPDLTPQFCEEQGGRYESRDVAEDATQLYCIFPDNTVCTTWAFYRGECQPGEPPTPVPPGVPLLEYTARYTDTTLGISFPRPAYWSVRMHSTKPTLTLARDSEQEFRVEVVSSQTTSVELEALLATIQQSEVGPYITQVDPIIIDEQPAFLLQTHAFSRPEAVPLLLAVVVAPCGEVLATYEPHQQAEYQILAQPLLISAKGIDQPLFEQFLHHVQLRELSPVC